MSNKEQRNQNINNKENSNNLKNNLLNIVNGIGGSIIGSGVTSGGIGGGVVGSISVNGTSNGNTSQYNSNSANLNNFEPSERKLNKKKKMNPIDFTAATTLPTQNKSNNLDTKKKKLEPNTNLNVNNQILNAKQHQILNSQNANENSIESNSSDGCIIIDATSGTGEAPDNNQSQLGSTLKAESSTTMPVNLPSSLIEATQNLVEIYSNRKLEMQNIWPNDFKAKLLDIYNDSIKLNLAEKSSFLYYLASKLGKTKDNLVRLIKRIPSQSQLPASHLQQLPLPKVEPTMTKNLTPMSKHHSSNNLVNSHQSPKNQMTSPSSINITFASLNEDFRANLSNLERNFKSFKSKNEDSDPSKFLDNSSVRSLLFTTDRYIKLNNKMYTLSLRDFCMTFLSNAFEMSKDGFQKKFEEIIYQQRVKDAEHSLATKLFELKVQIEIQTLKCEQKYNQQIEQYQRNLVNAGGLQQPVPPPVPKRHFEWSTKLRDLMCDTARLKMVTFRSTHASPMNRSQSEAQKLEVLRNVEREKFLKSFFRDYIVVLWHDSWLMTVNVLYSKYEANRNRNRNQGQQVLNRSSGSKGAGAGAGVVGSDFNQKNANNQVINISSKNGKQIRIEGQNVVNMQKQQQQGSPQYILKNVQPSKLKMDMNNISTTTSIQMNSSAQNRLSISNQQQIQIQSKTSPTSSPSSSSNQQQQQQMQISPSKQNIYDSIMNQFQKTKQQSALPNVNNILATTLITQQMVVKSSPQYQSSFSTPQSAINADKLNNFNVHQQQLNNKNFQFNNT
jgi:hypothetical protein